MENIIFKNNLEIEIHLSKKVFQKITNYTNYSIWSYIANFLQHDIS